MKHLVLIGDRLDLHASQSQALHLPLAAQEFDFDL
jgi:hypothetical protein